jgi:hypothetical protein
LARLQASNALNGPVGSTHLTDLATGAVCIGDNACAVDLRKRQKTPQPWMKRLGRFSFRPAGTGSSSFFGLLSLTSRDSSAPVLVLCSISTFCRNLIDRGAFHGIQGRSMEFRDGVAGDLLGSPRTTTHEPPEWLKGSAMQTARDASETAAPLIINQFTEVPHSLQVHCQPSRMSQSQQTPGSCLVGVLQSRRARRGRYPA